MTILLLALQWSSFFIMVMLMVGTLKHKDVLAHIIKLKFRVMLVTLRIEIYQVAFLLRHSTEVRGLCLMNYSIKRLHDLPYFYNCTFTIPCMYLDCCCFFHFVLVLFCTGSWHDPGLCRPEPSWILSLEYFSKHEPLFSEECRVFVICIKIRSSSYIIRVRWIPF